MAELVPKTFVDAVADAEGAAAALDVNVVDVVAGDTDAGVALGSAGVEIELTALVTTVSLAEACAVVTAVEAGIAEGDSDVAANEAVAEDDGACAPPSGLLVDEISG